MSLHKINDIREADFGCEEHSDGPHAVLVFEDGNKLEVTEKWIAEQEIKEANTFGCEKTEVTSRLFVLLGLS